MTSPTLPQILSLARTGSSARAWAVFVEAGWDQVTDDPKALTLKGRLLKDQAKAASGAEQRANKLHLYGEAAQAYAAAATLRTDSYPLINAAALSLLGGDSRRAAELAAQVLSLIDNDPNEGENAYWREATRAEALLLMQREAEACISLANAISHLPDAWEDHAATIGQFDLILNEQGRSKDWLDQHRPPSSVHFSGIIRLDYTDGLTQRAIEDFLDQEQPGFAYGALAAGADLLFAKAFLAHKAAHKSAAQLHVILPYAAAQFRALSVQPFGQKWLIDFDDVIAHAETVTILGMDDPPYAPAIQLADNVAMGTAMRNAANLQSRVSALTIAAQGEALRPHLNAWQQQGHDINIINGKRLKTEAGNFPQQDSSLSLATLIWINHGDAQQLKTILDNTPFTGDTPIIHRAAQGHWIVMSEVSGDVDSAWQIASAIAHDDICSSGVSMLHNIMDVAAPSPDLLARAKAYADVAQPGIVSTDQISAMAITRAAPSSNVEEVGALRTIWGVLPLWRLI